MRVIFALTCPSPSHEIADTRTTLTDKTVSVRIPRVVFTGRAYLDDSV
jgi:hypothetical protein